MIITPVLVGAALRVTEGAHFRLGVAGPLPEQVTFKLSWRMRRPSPDQGEERVFQTEGTEAEAALGQAGAGRWRKRKRPL